MSTHKGSWSRVKNVREFAENYDRIFEGKRFERKGAKARERRERRKLNHDHLTEDYENPARSGVTRPTGKFNVGNL